MARPLSMRLAAAAKAVGGIFSDRLGDSALGLLMGVSPGAVGEAPRMGTRDFLAAYSRMPWVRAVAGKVGTAVGAVQWQLFATRSEEGRAVLDADLQKMQFPQRQKLLREKLEHGDANQIREHPLLALLRKPNNFLTGMVVRKLTQIYLDLVGDSFWILERDVLGRVVEIWPLPPHWVAELPTIEHPFFRVSFQAFHGEIPATEILWFSDPDPLNPYGRGSGTAQAVSDELQTDEFAAKYTKSFFYNSARPDLIISGKELQPGDARRLEVDWLQKHRGFWRAYKPSFLSGEISVTKLEQDFRAIQFTEIREHERDTIVQVWGFPPEIFGILQSSNRATIDAADFLFARWIVVPRLEFIREILQERLVPEFDRRLILDFVSPVEEDKEFTLKVAQAAPWARNVNEWRGLQNLPAKPEDEGKLHAVPLGLTLMELGEEPLDEVGLDLPTEEGQLRIVGPQGKAINPDDSYMLIHRIARGLEPRMRRAFNEAVRLTRAKIPLDDLANALASGDRRAVEALIPFDDLRSSLGKSEQLIRASFEAAIKGANDLLRTEFGIEASFDLVNPRSIAWVQNSAGKLIREISEETLLAVQEVLERAIVQGIPPPRAAQEIRDLVGLTRRQAQSVANFRESLAAAEVAEEVAQRRVAKFAQALLRRRGITIARTELITAANAGQGELWQQAADGGVLDVKKSERVWIVTPDDRLDLNICEPMDGVAVPLNAPFELPNGNRVMHPGSGAHPQCRCAMRLRIKR